MKTSECHGEIAASEIVQRQLPSAEKSDNFINISIANSFVNEIAHNHRSAVNLTASQPGMSNPACLIEFLECDECDLPGHLVTLFHIPARDRCEHRHAGPNR